MGSNRIWRVAGVMTLLGLGLAGCNSTPIRDPEYAPTYPAAVAAPPQAETGAIYQTTYNVALFEDVKARRVGDILTIHLVESTNASKSSSNAVDRAQTSQVDNPTILGATPKFPLPGALPLSITDNNTLETKLKSDSTFKGKADTAQKNSLSGDISVTVADVFPNGNLLVRGEKRLNLNQGNEYVKISGIVRPLDIQGDNSVLSTKVADATIVYSGDGAAADANKVGWLTRFFASALFPF